MPDDEWQQSIGERENAPAELDKSIEHLAGSIERGGVRCGQGAAFVRSTSRQEVTARLRTRGVDQDCEGAGRDDHAVRGAPERRQCGRGAGVLTGTV